MSMPFKLRPLQKGFSIDFEDLTPPERLTITIWRNGRGKSATLDGVENIRKVLDFMKKLADFE